MHKVYFPVLFCLLFIGCKKNPATIDTTIFENTPQEFYVNPGVIDEASGIADSKANPGYLWVENDGNNTNDIFLLGQDGKFKKKFSFKTAVNRDWEDMTIAAGPTAGVNYIYLADIGDNFLRNPTSFIYRFP